MKIKKGDNVIVIAGKDKGKKSTVLRAFPALQMVIVEGVNMKKKHTRPRRSNQKGQIVEKPLPIHVSNIMLIDPKKGRGTRVGISRDGGKRVRVAKKSGATI
ncbi:MAG: 50S ribosomal protein L24 [Patescibacteria group bacterium]|mgnify:CR=1 FL=1